jgi:hypothetical protein
MSFALAGLGLLALAGTPELGDEPRLLELSERAGDRPHGDLHRIVGAGEIIAVGGLGISLDGEALASFAVLVGADIRGAAGRTGAGITPGVILGSFNSDNLPAADLGYGGALPPQSGR